MIKIALVPSMRFDFPSNQLDQIITIQTICVTDRLLRHIFAARHALYERQGFGYKVAILIDVDYLLNEQSRITPELREAVEDNIGSCIFHMEDMEWYIVDALHDRNRGVTAVMLRR